MISPNVFTVFNHGTDFHRDKEPDELITVLNSAMTGDEARIIQTAERTAEDPLPFRLESANPRYLICEGPGSDEVSAKASGSGVTHAHPGKYNPIFNSEKTPGKSHVINPGLTPTGGKSYWIIGEQQSSEFQDDFMGITAQTHKITGRAFGSGWDDNVYKAVWLITHLKWAMDQPIDTVNIIGWSRGAVTCLKMANKLFEVFEDTINVNIFAVDPVPGGFTPEIPDTRIIPPNVRNYLAVLALDDDRSNFQPLDRTKVSLLVPKSQHGKGGNPDSLNPRRLKPRVHFLPMPGNHADLVNSSPSSASVSASAKLIRHLAWQFLTAHNTPLTQAFDYTGSEIRQLYQELQTNRDGIVRAASSGLFGLVGGFRKERQVRARRGDYVQDSETYINEHHRMSMFNETEYPCGDSEESFSETECSAWNENKMLELPRTQACLEKMGITIKR